MRNVFCLTFEERRDSTLHHWPSAIEQLCVRHILLISLAVHLCVSILIKHWEYKHLVVENTKEMTMNGKWEREWTSKIRNGAADCWLLTNCDSHTYTKTEKQRKSANNNIMNKKRWNSKKQMCYHTQISQITHRERNAYISVRK